MKNTLENEMFDAAVSWCCSNGINVLEPEQLASLVNSLYITVRDADPTPANLVLVPLRPTRAMQDIFQQDDWQWADVLTAAESVAEEQYLFALEDDKQAQPEPVEQPIEALQKLGARLAALLDEDQWVECEALLIQAGAHQ